MISVNPSVINFGNQYAGSPSSYLICEVEVTGSESNVNIASPAGFQISLDNISWYSSINVGSLSDESFDLYIRVNSNSKVDLDDSVVITSGDPPIFIDEDDAIITDEDDSWFEDSESGSVSLSITVKANIMSLKVQPSNINFYNVYTGVRSVSVEMIVSNVNALYDINVEKITVPSGYKIKDDLGGSYNNEISAFMLGKGESVVFHLVVEPTAIGSFSDNFNITADFVEEYYVFVDEDDIVVEDEDGKMFEDSEVSV